MTKSGRSITKPTQFMPNTKLDSPSTTPRKSKKAIRRTSESAVCMKCLRGSSTASNMIVFCDGCNSPWHQYCHEPPIEREVIEIADAEWFCGSCEAEKEDARLPMDQRVGAGDLTPQEVCHVFIDSHDYTDSEATASGISRVSTTPDSSQTPRQRFQDPPRPADIRSRHARLSPVYPKRLTERRRSTSLITVTGHPRRRSIPGLRVGSSNQRPALHIPSTRQRTYQAKVYGKC